MKSNYLLLILLFYINLNSKSQNPICPIGTYIADPTGRVWNDGNIYIYGSTDDNVNHWCSYNHDILYSKDLISWNIKNNIFSTKGEYDKVKETDALLYAPDAMFRNGLYYLYFCTPDLSYSEGVAISKSPLGPFHSPKKLNITNHNEIDPTVFIDDDGQAYYYWGQATLKGAKMKSNMTEIDESTIKTDIITNEKHFFHEGSFVFKRNGIYYILYAHDGRRDRRPTCLGYATSNSPLGPFTYRGIVIDNFGCDPESWNNHGSIIQFKNQWYVLYHRSSHASQVMRRACIEPIYFNSDGSIDEVEMTSQGAGEALNAFSKIEAERACLLNGYCRIKLIATNNEAVCDIKNRDWIAYKYLNFKNGANIFEADIMPSCGGYINIRLDGIDGKIIGRLYIEPQKTLYKKIKTYSCNLSDNPRGIHSLYLEFIGFENGSKLFDIDNFYFK